MLGIARLRSVDVYRHAASTFKAGFAVLMTHNNIHSTSAGSCLLSFTVCCIKSCRAQCPTCGTGLSVTVQVVQATEYCVWLLLCVLTVSTACHHLFENQPLLYNKHSVQTCTACCNVTHAGCQMASCEEMKLPVLCWSCNWPRGMKTSYWQVGALRSTSNILVVCTALQHNSDHFGMASFAMLPTVP